MASNKGDADGSNDPSRRDTCWDLLGKGQSLWVGWLKEEIKKKLSEKGKKKNLVTLVGGSNPLEKY